MDVKFYHCKHCGNVAVKPFDNGAPLVCCGDIMKELVANTVDAAAEKHVPALTIQGNKVHIEVGTIPHPMTAEHQITFICLVTKKGYQVAPLSPEGEAKTDFMVVDGDVPMKAYEYCNLHGLWSDDL